MDPQFDKTVFAPRQNSPTGLFQRGDTVGAYQIEDELGRGGMGVVYLIKHTKLKKSFALKAMPPQLATEATFVARFNQEAETLARLKHSHIVNVTDFGESNGRLYLVLDFVDGGTLENWFLAHRTKGKGVPAADVLRIMGQILSGLEHAHKAGIIHRDLKPANVLLEKSGEAKISDFGLARVLAEEEERRGQTASPYKLAKPDSVTTTGTIVGTIDFMSPEARNRGQSDARSDIYAVGVMTYYLLTGRMPHGLAQPATKLLPGLDSRWDKFIVKCLEDSPDDRFQTAGAALASLREMGSAARIKWVVPVIGIGVAAAIIVGVALKSKPPQPQAGTGESPALVAASSPEKKESGAGSPAASGLAPAEQAQGNALTGTASRQHVLVGLPVDARVIFRGKSYAAGRDGRVAIMLPAGAQSVRISATNFQDWAGEIGAADAGAEETLTLQPVPAHPVRFTGLPAGANVTIGDRSVAADASGTAIFELRSGRVRVTATAPKYLESATEQAILSATDAIALAMEKIPPAAEIAINLGPEISLKFRFVVPGNFHYGSLPEERGRQRSDSAWTKAEATTGFYMAETETTQKQHHKLTGKNPSNSRALGDDSRPVEQVAWRDLVGPGGVLEKINEVLRQQGLPYTADLPTEVEWEYACRAGTETAFNNGQNVTNERDDPALNSLGHYARSGGLLAPAPVAKLKANAWGLFDMHGNVAEWTYGQRSRREPVLRGGHWRVSVVYCRSASRIESSADTRPTDFMGYRLVLRLKE